MSKSPAKLKDTIIRKGDLAPGFHGDGGNLYLRVSPPYAKKDGTITTPYSWVVRYQWQGKTREIGLGGYPQVTLSMARDKALEVRQAVKNGIDPLAEKHKEATPTLRELMVDFLKNKTGKWKEERQRERFKRIFELHGATLLDMRVDHITRKDVEIALLKIWHTKQVVATVLQIQIQRLLTYAKAKGFVTENVAIWKDQLAETMPDITHEETEFAAMALDKMPAMMADLIGNPSSIAQQLAFICLTGCRKEEVRTMRFSEIDLENAIFTVPATRMKTRKDHRVPLSKQALAIISRQIEATGGEPDAYVFPGRKYAGKPCGRSETIRILQGFDPKATVHGTSRANFTTWAYDQPDADVTAIEMQLSHTVLSKTTLAYMRSDLIEKRRQIVQAWADKLLTA